MRGQSEGVKMVNKATEDILEVAGEQFKKVACSSESVASRRKESYKSQIREGVQNILEQLLRDAEKVIVQRLQDRLKPM